MRYLRLACLALAGCTVTVSSDIPPGPAAAFDPGPTPLRRLTAVEYNNTVADLLGDTTAPGNLFPQVVDVTNQTFSNNVALQSADEETMQAYLDAAQTLSVNATSHLATLLPATCTVTAIDATCMTAFIKTFGQRAYRRPVTDDEATQLLAVYASGAAQFGTTTGVQLLLQVILADPSFLYRPEFGATGASGSNVALTSWEMASRLSYLLWSTMPDDALFELASTDQLTTPAQVADAARALLADPRAHTMMKQFHDEWLELTTTLQTSQKDPKLFPTFAATQDLMQQETETFFENVIWNGPGDLSTLLTANYSYLNSQLAAFYGVQGPSGSTFEQVALDPSSRAGFLTHASILSENAHLTTTSPTLRGKFVLNQLLCTVPGAPPFASPPTFPPAQAGQTMRDLVMAHAQSGCGGTCHSLMDPIGLGFEQYDPVGLYHASVDSGAGQLTMYTPAKDFTGGAELGPMLAADPAVAHCMTTQWFRWASGRVESDADAANIDALATAFESNGEKIQDLIVSIASSDYFRYRRAVGAN